MRGSFAVAAVVAAQLVAAGPGGAARPSAHRLPLLYVLASPDLHVGTSTDAPRVIGSGADTRLLYGCDPFESTRQGMRVCLRYDTLVVNAGLGALELRYDARGAAGATRATQRVYRADNTYTDRPAGTFYFDPAHGHFHYDDFVVASLWRSDRRGRRLGSAPVTEGHKAGFCLQDMNPYTGRAGEPVYTYPEACYPTKQPDNSLIQVNGISPGYLDVYDVTLTNQALDIGAVPDGYYLLRITIDPLRRLLIDPKSHTTSTQLIRLCGRQADIVGRTANCGKPATAPVVAEQWRRQCANGWCPVVPRVRPFTPTSAQFPQRDQLNSAP